LILLDFNYKDINDEYLLIILGIVSYLYSYYLIDYKDRYLKYFDNFDEFSKKEKIKWGWISFIAVTILWFFGFGSLIIRLTS
jgi:hypothetical protein